MNRLKTLRSYQSLLEAEGARAYLEAHGIQAQLPDRHSLYQQPHLIGMMGGARLQVPEDQFSRAEELLSEIERRSHLLPVDSSEEEPQESRSPHVTKWFTRLIVLVLVVYWLVTYF